MKVWVPAAPVGVQKPAPKMLPAINQDVYEKWKCPAHKRFEKRLIVKKYKKRKLKQDEKWFFVRFLKENVLGQQNVFPIEFHWMLRQDRFQAELIA